MKLVKTKRQKSMHGLPASYREWWNFKGEYEVFIILGEEICRLSISSCKHSNDITLQIAGYLGVDTSPEKIIKFGGAGDGRELYLSSSIDCVVLNYTKPKKYKDLLRKIENIVRDHFKN